MNLNLVEVEVSEGCGEGDRGRDKGGEGGKGNKGRKRGKEGKYLGENQKQDNESGAQGRGFIKTCGGEASHETLVRVHRLILQSFIFSGT